MIDYTGKFYKLIPFLLPALLTYAVFSVFPIVSTLYLSVVHWDGVSPQEFVFLANFVELFSDTGFHDALLNSLGFVAVEFVIKLPIALLLAYLLTLKATRLKKTLRFFYFLPCVLSAAAVGLMWQLIYDQDIGALNAFLETIGLGHLGTNWIGGDYRLFFVTLPTIAGSVGFNFVLYSAGLSAVPQELYDSADIDGANKRIQFFRIAIPYIANIIIMTAILGFSGAITQFEIPYFLWLHKFSGVAIDHVLGTLMYSMAFQHFRLGLSTSLSVFMFVVSLIVLGGLRALDRKLSY